MESMTHCSIFNVYHNDDTALPPTDVARQPADAERSLAGIGKGCVEN